MLFISLAYGVVTQATSYLGNQFPKLSHTIVQGSNILLCCLGNRLYVQAIHLGWVGLVLFAPIFYHRGTRTIQNKELLEMYLIESASAIFKCACTWIQILTLQQSYVRAVMWSNKVI